MAATEMTQTQKAPSLTLHDRVLGCLLGGACGDALGAPVEFMRLKEIQAKYGRAGITEFDEAYGLVGAITDDTQMALFTVEGLIRAYVRQSLKGICHPPSVIHHAYLRWLATQDQSSESRNRRIWMAGLSRISGSGHAEPLATLVCLPCGPTRPWVSSQKTTARGVARSCEPRRSDLWPG